MKKHPVEGDVTDSWLTTLTKTPSYTTTLDRLCRDPPLAQPDCRLRVQENRGVGHTLLQSQVGRAKRQIGDDGNNESILYWSKPEQLRRHREIVIHTKTRIIRSC